ncbi:Subtilase family protein [Andreprevotia lacus DSM 23236]|jgi:hypothetical protein|uniref:Subtilase family protein n=1 Tax=Andreprevotia lacus DSM 23236 TaxID=1121001 RepID=A0A1W1X2N1_9NEIS|nr:S8 family peptidase [Andreprevotia lacus]SMC18202.1 Subtilase family protein [Andreprevotia lacus DSM 23236]
MAEQNYPLLVFPSAAPADRDKRNAARPKALHKPSLDRQRSRIGPKFHTLQTTLEAQRLQLQATAPGENPEMVLVFDVIGSVQNFANTVKRTPGLEWLFEEPASYEADEDFFLMEDEERPLLGCMFLIGTNKAALDQIISLWQRYLLDPKEKFERGFNAWRGVFGYLRDVRYWSVQDRLRLDTRETLANFLESSEETLRIEIEAWVYSGGPERNAAVAAELTKLVSQVGGRVLTSALISAISYHGFLVALDRAAVEQLLSSEPPELAFCNRVMYFRPRGQAMALPSEGGQSIEHSAPNGTLPVGPPKIALLDGLPVQNHPLLQGRIIIDDPEDWEAGYEVKDRVHGTAMASLITRGDLSLDAPSLSSPIYVRPVLRPGPPDLRGGRAECTPDDQLLIDLFHRAVKRICKGDAGEAPAAPTVRVINLSLGDGNVVFHQEMSPWAKLLDWLAFEYNVLFVISAGNCTETLDIEMARDSFKELSAADKQHEVMNALAMRAQNRRLCSPAEAINGITVAGLHSDGAGPWVGRGEQFQAARDEGIAPYNRVGHGFRRAVKPDILFPGGRILYRAAISSPVHIARVSPVHTVLAPGHKKAAPITGGERSPTNFSRGTSNATALATRAAANILDMLSSMRAANPALLPDFFDTVITKALLVHGATWGGHETELLKATNYEDVHRVGQQNLLARALGYGAVNVDRVLSCTDQRATVIGFGLLMTDQALVFEVPLPPSLRARPIMRRMTVTLAWLTPTNPQHQAYRKAMLWFDPPKDTLSVHRQYAHWQQVRRGTVQHEILEGQAAAAFVDGDVLKFKVNCDAPAGKLGVSVPFSLCVSLEVEEGVPVPIYQEVSEKIRPKVPVQPGG